MLWGEVIHNCSCCVHFLCQQIYIFVNFKEVLWKIPCWSLPAPSAESSSASALCLRSSDISNGLESSSCLLEYTTTCFVCCFCFLMVPASFEFQRKGFRTLHVCASLGLSAVTPVYVHCYWWLPHHANQCTPSLSHCVHDQLQLHPPLSFSVPPFLQLTGLTHCRAESSHHM